MERIGMQLRKEKATCTTNGLLVCKDRRAHILEPSIEHDATSCPDLLEIGSWTREKQLWRGLLHASEEVHHDRRGDRPVESQDMHIVVVLKVLESCI